ncbi:hypothetical protein [Aquimarina sp. 2201CG5-10]|uniref:hypothetical protein n=1 Tax=Aquimarina callyspongiae TaxID=3098150 RepID=UPI002AB49EFA|nr:hypothetical protein [Aquimarina sp. 2201CG5-10]MDY8137172.1 hypothetical protein [Aquimarina sp. 2201CG5-10]
MKEIKIFLIIAITFCFTGCSLDDDERTSFFYELVPIEAVNIPDEFERGRTYQITTSYFRPSTCHSFSGFDYDRLSNERTVSVVNVVFEDRPCDNLDQTDTIDVSFDFFVGNEDSYVFRFWQGRNDQGENQFLTIEVPVVQ